MNQFWLVYNPLRNMPRRQHTHEGSAIREAERLARLHPGETFIVLEATHARRVCDMQTIDLRPNSTQETPF